MKKVASIILFLIASLSLGEALAKDVQMIFWYPGEAGSTEEAQGFIDAFTDKLNASIAPDRISGKYFNSTDEGLNFIRAQRPAVGIVSFAAWAQNGDKVPGSSVVMSTLPLPGGRETERYSLVAAAGYKSAAGQVLSSEPMGEAFVRKNLFPDLPQGIKFRQDPQILSSLKKIANGEMNALAILTPMEAATLARLSAPWAKSLGVVSESKDVPTARVVLMDKSWKGQENFCRALLGMASDGEGKEILSELRLTGFKK